MRKRLKNAWDRLPKWSRRWQVARNLALCVLLLALLIMLLDWPVFTRKQAILRLAEMSLLAPCEIVLEVGEDGFLLEGEDFVAAGRVDEYGSTWKPLQAMNPRLCHVVPKGELVVVGVPVVANNCLTVAVTGLPEEAASGKLQLTISGVDDHGGEGKLEEEEVFSDWGYREGDWMIFNLGSHGDHPGFNRRCIMDDLWWELTLNRGLDPYPWTLELLDGDGWEIGVVSGTLPQDLRFLDQNTMD